MHYEGRSWTAQPPPSPALTSNLFKNIWDLYIQQLHLRPHAGTKTGDESCAEFGKARLSSSRTAAREYSNLTDAGMNPDDLR